MQHIEIELLGICRNAKWLTSGSMSTRSDRRIALLVNSVTEALEQLATSELERADPGWTLKAHPLMPVILHQTVRSLADRGLCRIVRHSVQETARITQNGRKAWREIEAARARIRSAA